MTMSIAFTYVVRILMQNFILRFLMGICILVLRVAKVRVGAIHCQCTDNPVDLNKWKVQVS